MRRKGGMKKVRRERKVVEKRGRGRMSRREG